MVTVSPTKSEPAVPAAGSGEQRLSTMFEIAKVLAAENDLGTMLPRLLSGIVETMEAADAGALMLQNPADGRLEVAASHGFDEEALKAIRLSPGESMTGRAFETGESTLYQTPEAAAAAMSNLTPLHRDKLKDAANGRERPFSAICIPLTAGVTKVGVLVLENWHQPGSFDCSELPFLEAVAGLLAVAIESARVRNELQSVQAVGETNRLKAELISLLAHEMRTPLTSIKGYSTALLMEDAEFPLETQREFLQIIDDECDVLQGLIRDLLESSIIDAGLLKLEFQPVLLPRLTKSVADDFARRSPEHQFLVDFPREFPVVEADPDRITQVLRNLLDNAIKYSPQGGLIVVRGEARSDEIVISVADKGVGIAPEDLNRLFERFFRAQSGLGRHVVGSGLGLPIARTIVESHHGRIWAESRTGQGSTFFFTLPLQPRHDGAMSVSVNAEEPIDA